mmetsp:Transcript_149809/g.481191  ORF Transcript_149809/g.481191 Transcript_149809/m.481191 type:complete len:249 (-) Transcript_149809:570-1316(-)
MSCNSSCGYFAHVQKRGSASLLGLRGRSQRRRPRRPARTRHPHPPAGHPPLAALPRRIRHPSEWSKARRCRHRPHPRPPRQLLGRPEDPVKPESRADHTYRRSRQDLGRPEHTSQPRSWADDPQNVSHAPMRVQRTRTAPQHPQPSRRLGCPVPPPAAGPPPPVQARKSCPRSSTSAAPHRLSMPTPRRRRCRSGRAATDGAEGGPSTASRRAAPPMPPWAGEACAWAPSAPGGSPAATPSRWARRAA